MRTRIQGSEHCACIFDYTLICSIYNFNSPLKLGNPGKPNPPLLLPNIEVSKGFTAHALVVCREDLKPPI